MSEIMKFSNNEFGTIRTDIDENGKILFCGNDVAKALGYTNPRKAIADHCIADGVTKRYTVTLTTNQYGKTSEQRIETNFIDEGNMYRLITHSKLPSAVKFERWVFDEILPSIRKNGGYIVGQESMNDSQLQEAAQNVVQNIMNERESLLLKLFSKDPLETANAYKRLIEIETAPLLETIEEQKPKAIFADTVMKAPDNIKIGAFAKILNTDGINIGEKRLFKLLRDRGVLMKTNIPYQDFIDNGFFVIHEGTYVCNAEQRLYTTTLITPKGQVWLTNKIRSWLEVV